LSHFYVKILEERVILSAAKNLLFAFELISTEEQILRALTRPQNDKSVWLYF